MYCNIFYFKFPPTHASISNSKYLKNTTRPCTHRWDLSASRVIKIAALTFGENKCPWTCCWQAPREFVVTDTYLELYQRGPLLGGPLSFSHIPEPSPAAERIIDWIRRPAKGAREYFHGQQTRKGTKQRKKGRVNIFVEEQGKIL